MAIEDKNIKYFLKNLQEIREKYGDEALIVICDEKIIAHAENCSELSKKLIEKDLGGKSLVMINIDEYLHSEKYVGLSRDPTGAHGPWKRPTNYECIKGMLKKKVD